MSGPSDHQIKRTFHGQASWCLEWPPKNTCRECENWSCEDNTRKYAYKNHHNPHELRPAKCKQCKSIGLVFPAVPHYAGICRLFIKRRDPLPAKKPKELQRSVETTNYGYK